MAYLIGDKIDAGLRDGVWFLTMEWVDGVDFSTLSRGIGPLAPADACELIRQAAIALQHAHGHKLIHRDVKPSNLMLSVGPDGSAVVKVLDFGLAHLAHRETVGGELTNFGEPIGTVDRLLSADPAQRFPTAGDVAEALAPFAAGADLVGLLARVPRATVPELDLSAADPPSERLRLWVRRLMVAAALLVVAASVGDAILRPPTPSHSPVAPATASPSPPLLPLAGPPLRTVRGIILGADGAFYGGSLGGGDFDQGALYRFTPPAGVEVLVHFTGADGPARGVAAGRSLLQARDGMIYGVADRRAHRRSRRQRLRPLHHRPPRAGRGLPPNPGG